MTSTALVSRRKAREHEERIIDDSLRSMENAGAALARIKNEELWKDDYDSFEDYCIKRWKFRAGRAYQLIAGAEFVSEMKAHIEEQKKPDLTIAQVPLCEGHVRALTNNADGIEEQTRLLAASLKAAGNKPLTKSVIDKTATELYGAKKNEAKVARVKKATTDSVTPEASDGSPASEPIAETTQFDPEELEGTAPPKPEGSDGAKRVTIAKMAESLQKKLESALEDTGPYMRAMDDCHAGDLHKQVVAHYRRVAADLTTAIEAHKELMKTWVASGRKKAS